MTAAVLQKTDVILFVTAKTVVMSKTVVRHNVYMFISSGIWWLYLCVLFLTCFLFSFIGWMLGYQGRDFVCDFEHEEKCGWTVRSGEGGYVWQRQQRGNMLPDSGPSSDYTSGTSTGTWWFSLPSCRSSLYLESISKSSDRMNYLIHT